MFFHSWGAKLGAVALGLVLWMHAITEQSFDREVMVRLLVEDPELPPESKPIVRNKSSEETSSELESEPEVPPGKS